MRGRGIAAHPSSRERPVRGAFAVGEDDVAFLAGFDRLAVLGADRERAGERHRGEDAGALRAGEADDGAAVLLVEDDAGVEAAAVGVADPVSGDGADHGARPGVLLAEHLEDRGAAKQLEGEHGGDRVAGEPEVRDLLAAGAAEGAEGEWLAGLHLDGPEADFALVGEDGLDDVEVAAGDAGGGDEHVGVGEGFVDTGGQRLDGVAGDIEDLRDAAEAADLGGEREGVGVVDLAGRERLAGAEQLVARAEDGDDRAAVGEGAVAA